MKKLMVLLMASMLGTVALAKLAAPSDEARAAAAKAAAKAAWDGKVDAYLYCKSQDKVAAHYYKTAKATKPAVATPACVEPGAFSYKPAVVEKPLEAAGAHSPAPTATSPPSSKTPAAAVAPAPKP